MAVICGLRIPAPSPWKTRAAMRVPGSGARPQAREPTAKSTSPTRKIFLRPKESPSRPAGTSARPNTTAYPVTIHCSWLPEAPRPCEIEGSATLTMLTSSRVMKPATRQTHSTRHRSGSTSGWASGVPGRASGRAGVTNDHPQRR